MTETSASPDNYLGESKETPKIPPDVKISFEARKPILDPTMGIPVEMGKTGNPPHRLVTIGDSLTQGFKSGGIYNTSNSYPVIIAREMGWKDMRYPSYGQPEDGLPINLEYLARDLSQKFGDSLRWWNWVSALLRVQKYLGSLENYWERGEGSKCSQTGQINHNLAVYGWDLRNTLSRNADICLELLAKEPQNDLLRQVVEYHNERAALRVLNTARDESGKALTPLQAAKALGEEGGDIEGIETLVVMIGANNALGALLTMKVKWSDDGYDNMDINDQYTVWRPIHFQAEYDLILEQLEQIRARNVILATIPHITILPFLRGIGTKVRERSRYFSYYTVPWIDDKIFDPQKHPYLCEQEVRAIDSAIDQYNEHISNAVRRARQKGKNWFLFDSCGILDRLAMKRYIEDPDARPDWWDEVGGEYKLAPELRKLNPPLNSLFFHANARGRTTGGLFSLDGVHPSTIGYGIMAQEIIKIMQLAGVKFYEPDGVTERTGEIKVDWNRLIAEDGLISNTPTNVDSILGLIGGFDKRFNVLSNVLKRNY